MDKEGLAKVWAERRQPSDIREALIQVYLRCCFKPVDGLPSRAEVIAKHGTDNILTRCCITRESELERQRRSAISKIDQYLQKQPLLWRPGMWKPQIAFFVDRPVRWRAGGKCEDCRYGFDLEMHHLHYRSVGREVPDDLLLLCRRCHQARPMFCGVFFADPEKVRWSKK
jgi:5-methylcytosine-specific restriction endonuclease McrA